MSILALVRSFIKLIPFLHTRPSQNKIKKRSDSTLCRVRGHARLVVSLTRPAHSQKRVWYVTVQLIVLADSGCRVYTRSHSTQTANHIYIRLGGSTPRKWNKLLHCKVPDTFPRKGVARETKGGGGGGHSHRPCTSTHDWGSGRFRGSEPPSALVFKKIINSYCRLALTI